MADSDIITCSKCHKGLSLNEYIRCKQCNRKFHWNCVHFPENVRPMVKEIKDHISYLCEECEKSTKLPIPNIMSEQLTPLSANPILPSTVSELVPHIEETRKGGDYTKVNIKHADNIIFRCETGEFSGSHSEAPYKQNKKIHSRKDESRDNEIINTFRQDLKHRLGRIEAKIPTIICDGSELHYPIQDYFAELQLQEKDLFGLSSDKRIIGLKEIFHAKDDDGIRIKRNILITGDPGFGKTTFAKKLCYDWATLEPPNYMSDFDMVVNIPLRKMGNEPIEVSILNEICSSAEDLCQSANILKGLHVLVILDGFDEIGERSNLISFLKDHKLALKGLSDKSTVIVTSRPYAVGNIHYLFDRRISILGFSGASQKKYIRKILPKLKAEDIIRRAEKDSFLSKASECPLLLHLICCVYGNDDETVISSRTELYLQIFKLLIQSYVRKNGANNICKRLMQAAIAEDKIFINLGEIAIIFLETPRSNFGITEDNLKEKFKEKEELEFVLGLGILLAIPILCGMRVVVVYEFLHRTFAEFLVSIYLSDSASKTESKWLRNSVWYMNSVRNGFLPGLLGEKFLKDEYIVETLIENQLTLPELHNVKNEAHLSGESLELFCSWVKSIEYTYKLEDRHLFFELTLPNLCDINIISSDEDEGLWEYIMEILVKFKSSYSLFVGPFVLSDAAMCCSEQTSDRLCFINMEKVMTKLIGIENVMRSHAKDFSFIVSLYINPLHIDRLEVQCRPSKIKDITNNLFYSFRNLLGLSVSKKIKHTGLIPHHFNLRRYLPLDYCSFWWIFGNMKIVYKPNSHDVIIPIIVVSSEEYSILTKEPFFHKTAQGVVDFIQTDNSPMDEFSIKSLKTASKYRHVYSTDFFQRLKEFRSEIGLFCSEEY